MIIPNNIVADYQFSRLYKDTGRKISFADNLAQSIFNDRNIIEVDGIIIPESNFETNYKGETWIASFKDVRAERPLPIKEGLKKIASLKRSFLARGYRISEVEKHILNNIADFAKVIDKSPYLRNRTFFKIINNGGDNVAVNIGYNQINKEYEVLKISREPNHPEVLGRIHERSFDLPVFSQGKINGLHYYIQPMAITEGITSEMVEEVRQKIEKKGYELADDFGAQQIGIYRERPYLLDPDCAVAVQN